MIMQPRTELINGGGQVGAPPPGRRERMIKIRNTFRQIRSVNLERNRHLGKCRSCIGNLRGQCRHPSHLGREQRVHCQALPSFDVITDGALVPGQPLIEGCELWLMIMIDEDSIHLAHRVVSGGTGDWPGLRQFLAWLEDLLYGDPLLRGERSQPMQVAKWIAQAVGVVDTQPGYACLAPIFDECMGGREDVGILNAYAGECGDREESAVVDLGIAA